MYPINYFLNSKGEERKMLKRKMRTNLWIRFFFRLCRTTSACHTHIMNKLQRKSSILSQQILYIYIHIYIFYILYIYVCINKTQAVLASRNQYHKHEVTVHSSEECSPGSVVTSLNSVANDCWLHVYTDEISRDLCS